MTVPLNLFGGQVWAKLRAQPLGSLTKRELELVLIGAAADSGLIAPKAEDVAEIFNIPITRSHGYLTDLALRKPAISDFEGVKELVALLKDSEVIPDQNHISIPLHNAALRIWLERKMTRLRLNSGDTLRRDNVKLTPSGLAKIIGAAEGLLTPFDALKLLPPEVKDADWVKAANKLWKKGMGWKDALSVLGNTVSIGQVVIPVIFRVI